MQIIIDFVVRKIRDKSLSTYNEIKTSVNDMSEYRLNNSTLSERTIYQSCTGYKVCTQFTK